MNRIALVGLAGLLVALAGFLMAGASAQAEHSADSNKFYILNWYNDYWYNWDFENSYSLSSSNVDWPVNVIFVNNATINIVKNAYLGLSDSYGQKWHQNKPVPPGGTCGSTKWMWLDDASVTTGPHWDRDDGIKGGYRNSPGGYLCVPTDGRISTHFRLYADNPQVGGNDKMGYNLQWGYWVMASSHWDFDECNYPPPLESCNPLYGWTETAEAYVGWDARTLWGYSSVSWNRWGFLNDQAWPNGQWAGEHYVYNNGWATEVRLP